MTSNKKSLTFNYSNDISMKNLCCFFLYISVSQILLFSCGKPIPCEEADYQIAADKMKGMTVFASYYPIQNTPIQDLNELGVNSITVIPLTNFSPSTATFDSTCMMNGMQCNMGHIATRANIDIIQKAKAKQMTVMVKPQVWSMEGWMNELDNSVPITWNTFHQGYLDYIIKWAKIADEHQAEIFCIGTELQSSISSNPDFWGNLIDTVRHYYHGKLTYASNWDDTHLVPFWGKMDYIGIDTYFPLSEEKIPSVCELKQAWIPIHYQIKKYYTQYQKPILFTEFGYMSVEKSASKTWNLEATKDSIPMNEQAQANAMRALLQTFGQQDWWAGGFQWKWYADPRAAVCDGDLTKEYTPENKLGEEVLQAMY